MSDENKKGLALLILGVILALGGTVGFVYGYFIGVVLGVIGTFMLFNETDGDQK